MLSEYYAETVSEGSGQYDEQALRRLASVVTVRAEDVKWFEQNQGPLSDNISSTVYGVILQDAMSAMVGNPGVAWALESSRVTGIGEN